MANGIVYGDQSNNQLSAFGRGGGHELFRHAQGVPATLELQPRGPGRPSLCGERTGVLRLQLLRRCLLIEPWF